MLVNAAGGAGTSSVLSGGGRLQLVLDGQAPPAAEVGWAVAARSRQLVGRQQVCIWLSHSFPSRLPFHAFLAKFPANNSHAASLEGSCNHTSHTRTRAPLNHHCRGNLPPPASSMQC